MLGHYITTSFRFVFKNKTFSVINILGLSIGTLCCLYIVMYVLDQFNYDTHHKDVRNIYRINSAISSPGDVNKTMATASPPIAPTMKNDFPEIKEYTRTSAAIGISRHLLRYRERSIYETDALFVDSTFFDVLTYRFVHGQQHRVLSEPYSIVLLKPTADKLFGNENPIGKTLSIENGYGKNNFRITAVVEEAGKSHLRANMFITMNSGGIGEYVRLNTNWAGNNFTASYIKLRPGASISALEKKLPQFLKKYGQDQLRESGMKKELKLQPVRTIHTTTGLAAEATEPMNPIFLNILLAVAGLIQLIACINFMNLSTARASKRAKEVGVRKVIGAAQKDLVKQFLGESLMLAVIAMMLTIPLLWLLLPKLNAITKTDVPFTFFQDARIWLLFIVLVLFTGLVSGSYPAFYLSAFNVLRVIKGNLTNHISATGIRKALVVFQFTLSIVLITGIIIIYSQLRYIKNKDLGFEAEQTMVFSFHTDDAKKKIDVFVDDLKKLPEVGATAKSNNYLSQFVWNDIGVYLKGGNMADSRDAPLLITNENFVKANRIRIVGGRDFQRFDSTRVLINETLASSLGLDAKSAPGTNLYWNLNSEAPIVLNVVGVMQDFNYNSLREGMKPLMLVYNASIDPFSGSPLNFVTVALNSNEYGRILSKIEGIWNKHLSGVPFEYAFLDDEVQKQYEAEITLARIINSFALMAVFISCMGLFGLSAFMVEQRTKEIGIRKVLGAKVIQLSTLLSKEFIILVSVAMLIATPIAWYVMNQWLQAFAYKVDLRWWMFAGAGAIALVIAMITVSFQAIKASLANPVRCLRTE